MKIENFLSTITEAQRERLDDLGFTPEEFVEAYNEHNADYRDDSPSVYCGSYHKYNCGSLYGQWIDLTTFSDYDEFATYCQALHCDEDDCEPMFQDYENFPQEYYDECMGEKEFDSIFEYLDKCERHGKEAIDAFISLYGSCDLHYFEDKYIGKWDTKQDFAEHIIWECYDLRDVPELVKYHIDYESIARDLFMCDYDFEDGYVFTKY